MHVHACVSMVEKYFYVCLLLYLDMWVFVYLQYGKDYEFDAPVKLLDKHLHAMAQSVDEQLVVVSQVYLSSFIHMFSNISMTFVLIV